MPLDPQIPLAVRPIDIQTPTQSIGMLMQMRNLASEVQLRQAQVQHAQAQAENERAITEQHNRDLADQKTIQDAYADPVKAKAFGMGDFSSIAPYVQPKTHEALTTQALQHQQAAAATTKESLANIQAQHGIIEDTINGLRSLGDDGKIQEAAPGAFNALISQGVLPPGTPMPKITGAKDLDQYAAQNGYIQGVLTRAADLQEKQQKVKTSEAQEAEARASAAVKVPQAKIEEAKAQLMHSALAGGATDTSGIDTIIPPDKYPQQNIAARAAYKLGLATGDIAKAQENVMKIYAEQVAPVEKQKAEIPGEISKAMAIEKAKAPIEMQRAITVANTNRANAGAEKLDTEYNTARSTTEALGRILDLAQSGNKAAGSNVPLVGVETLNAINGIKRVNSMEINQYGSAGSLLDKIKGKIGSLTVGQPIPQDVLNDIRELHESLGQQSYEKYTTGLKSLEQRTPGAKLPPTIPPPSIRAATPTGGAGRYKAGDTRVINGVTYVRDDKGMWSPK